MNLEKEEMKKKKIMKVMLIIIKIKKEKDKNNEEEIKFEIIRKNPFMEQFEKKKINMII